VVAFNAVSLSCVFGLLISFFGFACREALSATTFAITSIAGVSSPSAQMVSCNPAPSKLMDNKDDGDDYSEEDEKKGV
ncbi:hypothetical protein Tco_1481706, partial [Tanacetum coccineum]